MAYSAHVGSFNIDTAVTAGNTQAITGVGFQPKIVLFWWSGTTATSDGARGEDVCFGFGAATSATERACVYIAVDDAAATTASYRAQLTDACIASNLNGSATVDGLADLSSLDSDGFTLTIDDQFSTAVRVTYLALGGTDLTNVKVGSQTRGTTGGNNSYTGVGFQPDAMLTGSVFSNSTDALIGIGMATGASNQGAVTMWSDHGVATSQTIGYGYNGEVQAMAFTTGITGRDAFVSFDSDGFTFNNLELSGGAFIYVALKGGQYHVGDIETRTDTNDIAETAPGFQPVALLFLSANRALSTQDTATSHGSLSIGAATSTSNRGAQAVWDENNLADSETATANYDTAAYAHVRDDAIAALMDIKSIDASGFTAVMDDTEPSVGSWVTYLAIGATGGGGVTVSCAAGTLTLAGQTADVVIPTLEQEGFRWRDDDGSESAATWLATQDTNISRDRNENTRLRVLVNATGDPASNQYRLEYRRGERTTLSDDFTDNSFDTSKWEKRYGRAVFHDDAVTVVEANNYIEITPLSSTSGEHANGAMALNTLDFWDCNAVLEILQAVNAAEGVWAHPICIWIDDNNEFSFTMGEDPLMLGLQLYVDEEYDQTNIAFNATDHKWVRLRHDPSDNTIKWETSPDGSDWTVRRSAANPFTITSVEVAPVSAGTWQSEASPGTFRARNFSLQRNAGGWTAI